MTKCHKCGSIYGRHRSAMCRDGQLHKWSNVEDKDAIIARLRREVEILESLKTLVKESADQLEKIVWRINNDERHAYPDPCLVCESNDEVYAVVTTMRDKLEKVRGEK